MIASFNLTVGAHDELLSLYFTHLNGFNGFVDEDAFRLGIAKGAPTDGYSLFLHLCILSTALHISPYRQQYGSVFIQAAYTMLASEIDRPKSTTVIAMVLLSLEASESGSSSAWILSGKQLSKGNLTP